MSINTKKYATCSNITFKVIEQKIIDSTPIHTGIDYFIGPDKLNWNIEFLLHIGEVNHGKFKAYVRDNSGSVYFDPDSTSPITFKGVKVLENLGLDIEQLRKKINEFYRQNVVGNNNSSLISIGEGCLDFNIKNCVFRSNNNIIIDIIR
jgi:hypothetical protein